MDELERKLHSRSVAERMTAVKALARQPIPNEEALLQALCDKSNIVVAAAAEALGDLLTLKAVDPLIERYWWMAQEGVRRDQGCLARIAVIQTLTKCRAGEAAAVLLHAIKSVQPEKTGFGMDDTAIALRAQAAAALAELVVPGALLAISLLLFDQEPQVPYVPQDRMYVTMATRIAAARSLAALGDAGGVAPLGIRLTHPDEEIPEVLVECMDALVVLDGEAALQLLIPYLSHSSSYLVAGAATALASLPARFHTEVLAVLCDACSHTDPEATASIALAIAAVRSDAAVAALTSVANHHEPGVRLAAVDALKQRGDPASIAALEEIAHRKGDPKVTQAARMALRSLNDDKEA